MSRAAILFLLLGACSSTADRELAAVKSAHSIVAEWAAIARLHSEGRVAETYARVMEDAARSQMATARKALQDPNDPAARLIDALSGPHPDATRLAEAAAALGALEQAREAR